MKSDSKMRARLGFLARFAIVFGLLIVPWPGWNDGYGQYFRAFGQWFFSNEDGQRMVAFSPNKEIGSSLDTQISLGNRQTLDESGKGLIKRTELDTRSIGWLPTALTVALVGATPIPWRRRVMALIGGLVLIHLFILFSLQTWIWNNSADVSLISLSDCEKRITYEVNYAFMDQLGISFTVPVLIWVLVTFKRHDQLA